MQTFEQTCARLLQQHDLTRIALDYARDTVHCYVHWDGFSRSGGQCASGHGKTAGQAFALAIAEASVIRTPSDSDEAFPLVAA